MDKSTIWKGPNILAFHKQQMILSRKSKDIAGFIRFDDSLALQKFLFVFDVAGLLSQEHVWDGSSRRYGGSTSRKEVVNKLIALPLGTNIESDKLAPLVEDPSLGVDDLDSRIRRPSGKYLGVPTKWRPDYIAALNRL